MGSEFFIQRVYKYVLVQVLHQHNQTQHCQAVIRLLWVRGSHFSYTSLVERKGETGGAKLI